MQIGNIGSTDLKTVPTLMEMESTTTEEKITIYDQLIKYFLVSVAYDRLKTRFSF